MPLVRKTAQIPTSEFLNSLPLGENPIDVRITVGINNTTINWYESGEIVVAPAQSPAPVETKAAPEPAAAETATKKPRSQRAAPPANKEKE